ncbi:hypothetical protein ACP3V9_24235, partial [Salmonella enterica]
ADLGDDWETLDDEISVSLGDTEFTSYNGLTPETYNVYNSTVTNHLFGSFGYWGTDNVFYPDEEWGTYEVVGEDPLTVEYTINDEVQWSD